jgi:hypothetical protein
VPHRGQSLASGAKRLLQTLHGIIAINLTPVLAKKYQTNTLCHLTGQILR